MTEQDSALRAETQQKNYDALVALLAEFNFTIPARDFANWRPTRREVDVLTGLEELGTMTILCTNGILALFLKSDGQILHGHVGNFQGKVAPLHSMPAPHRAKAEPKERKPKTNRPGASRSPRVTKASIDAAMALIQQLMKDSNVQS